MSTTGEPAIPSADKSTKTLNKIIRDNVDKTSIIVTDEFKSYKGLDKEFKEHQVVNHGLAQYVNGSACVNTAEAFFSIMKRGIKGIYQHVSKQHLHCYADEFGFRWNTRKQTDVARMILGITRAEGKRLMYQDA